MKLKTKYIFLIICYGITESLCPSFSHDLDVVLPNVSSLHSPIAYHIAPWCLEVEHC